MSNIIELADGYSVEKAKYWKCGYDSTENDVLNARVALVAAVEQLEKLAQERLDQMQADRKQYLDLQAVNRDCVDHFNQMREERDALEAKLCQLAIVISGFWNSFPREAAEAFNAAMGEQQ